MDVNGDLDLNNTLITLLPDGLIVGGTIYFNNTEIESNLKHGDYVQGKYLYADGILTPIKYDKQIGKYTYHIGKFKDDNVVFDEGYYTHCRTFKQCVNDIAFKYAANRGSE